MASIFDNLGGLPFSSGPFALPDLIIKGVTGIPGVATSATDELAGQAGKQISGWSSILKTASAWILGIVLLAIGIYGLLK